MPKQIVWKTPNHMEIDTGHKTFDHQCEALGTGNFYGTCQSSSYIRPFIETKCNDHTWDVGELQDSDLKNFVLGGIPEFILKEVKEAAKEKQCILYEIHHWTPRRGSFQSGNKNIIHGYILTDGTYKFLKSWVTNNSWKSIQIIGRVTQYVSEIA